MARIPPSATTNPDHLPQIFARNLELILSLQGEEGALVVSELVEEAKEEGQEQFEQTVTLVDIILSFAEDFVQQASEMDGNNKKVLGKIIRAMTSKDIETVRDREEYLDELMEQEKGYFTPGFLRHIDGECERIANAPKMSPESARLMEIMRMIQTRVLEELGKDMGEATLVLGQLMGYDDKNELLGVLDAGLTVRGMDFCQELKALTEEALDGFKRVNGGVDPELVESLTALVCFLPLNYTVTNSSRPKSMNGLSSTITTTNISKSKHITTRSTTYCIVSNTSLGY
jgi:hypothetical protein